MLKVLAMRDTYHVSGPCRGILHLAKEAKSTDVQFIVGMFLAGSHLTSPAIEEFKRQGLQVAVWIQKHRYDPWLIHQAWKTVREHRVAILQSHGYKPAVLAWFLQRLMGLPWIALAHGYTSENRRLALYNKLDLRVMRSADRVIAVSSATGRFLEQHGIPRSRIRVIQNAIDPQAYQPRKSGTGFRQRCGVGPHHVLVGVIGRLSPEKGHALFLRALSQVVKVIPETKAVIVGDGQEAKRLEVIVRARGLNGHVTFAGYQSDISSVYSALDLVVIPSESEGLPNVLLEAFLHRKAVVATAVGGIPEVMQGKLSQWLVPPGDSVVLGETIIQALRCKSSHAELVEAGAKLVQGVFTPARRADQFLRVYEELVAAEA